MLENYLIVHKSILPDKYEKVLDARRLLETGQVKEVSQAAKQAGISRSTYYKYRDFIFEPSERSGSRTAVLEMLLTHTAGQLSAVLSVLSEAGASVLTITQSLPIHSKASVTISIDITDVTESVDSLSGRLSAIPGLDNLRLLAIE